MCEYGYAYKRSHELSESEIYQAGAAQAELEAAKKAVVSFYREESTGEILTFCQNCFNPNWTDLTLIDKAADWDECPVCGAQNIPAWYHGEVK